MHMSVVVGLRECLEGSHSLTEKMFVTRYRQYAAAEYYRETEYMCFCKMCVQPLRK